MKKLVSVILISAFLVCLTSAAAGNAGSASDPLVSLAYIEGTYVPGVTEAGEGKIAAMEERVSSKLDESAAKAAGAMAGLDDLRFASGYDRLELGSGAAVRALTGAGVIMLSGYAAITVNRGTVVNVSTGEEVPGGAMTAGERYVVAENSDVTFGSESGAVCLVSGLYALIGDVTMPITRYLDVNADSWFNPYVKYIYDNSLYYDAGELTFRPDEYTSRATLVYALWVLSGRPDSPPATFKDLTEDWYVPAVAWANNNGIVKGYDENTFGPNNDITREQIATIIYRYAAYRGEDVSVLSDLEQYEDVDLIADWAITEVRWANARGLIIGMTDTTIVPQFTATRAQVAAIIMRYDRGE